MYRLPIIVGFGGYNAAGRSSFHHGFRRMVIESLDDQSRLETLAGLGVMTRLIQADSEGFKGSDGQLLSLAEIEQNYGEQILSATLIRRIEPSYFDVEAVPCQQSATVAPDSGEVSFLLARRQLPQVIPASWEVSDYSKSQVRVRLAGTVEVKVNSTRSLEVKSAGQLPSGFAPGDLYNSHFHPRGLQMTVVGMSDALHSMGIDWPTVKAAVRPDEIGVFAGSLMSQLDEYGFGGMIQARMKGGRVTAKQLPLGLNTMPGDFINAYMLGSMGMTGGAVGACATFLYNLRLGVEAIQSGKVRVAVVGNSEAPIVPDIIDGYNAMSALANYEGLKKVEGTDTPDLRRSSRPFGENCGFTIAESSQFVVLMDDELALQLGAQVHGAVPDVFINADGYKKSISAPGPGNYLTLSKAVAAARALVGEDSVQQRSMVHAHGSSTPANRVTESELLERVAEVFGIENWPVTAVKAYVGHSLAPASGDQLVSSLGSFKYGLVPGIKTIDRVADDVHQKRLQFSTRDMPCPDLEVAFINSKGFGGNNATGVVLAPQVVEAMLTRRYGETRMADYRERRHTVEARAQAYDQAALKGQFDIVYNFGLNMVDDKTLSITDRELTVPGCPQAVRYAEESPYQDMT